MMTRVEGLPPDMGEGVECGLEGSLQLLHTLPFSGWLWYVFLMLYEPDDQLHLEDRCHCSGALPPLNKAVYSLLTTQTVHLVQ